MKVKTPGESSLRIGELSERTGVPAHRLRHYEDRGLLSSFRDANDYRYFDTDAVVTVARIVTLLHAGLNLDEVAEVLPRLDDGGTALDEHAQEVLRARAVLLEAQITCLATAKRALDRILAEGGTVRAVDEYDACGTGRLAAFNVAGRPGAAGGPTVRRG